jgi:small ligand-binding sensory domain FIST
VAFDARVELISRVTQGCQPLAPKAGGPARTRTITRAQRNVIYELDGRPALELLFDEQRLDLDDTRAALPALRQILVGLTPAHAEAAARAGQFGSDTVVRHLIGIDVGNRGIAIGDLAEEGMQLTFCRRDREAARRDLVRICSEIRSELEPEELSSSALAQQLAAGRPAAAAADARRAAGAATARIRGAVYVSCAGRGGPHFAGDAASSAELRIVQQALGEVPLVGFFAGGEIARHHLYGYTGVLTCFVG